jgi:predicted Zn-dependent peptidase
MDLLREPTADAATLEELKKIILVRREDGKKDFQVIGSAVRQFNRYGGESPFLKALPSDAIDRLSMSELQDLIRSLQGYRHAITYTGSLPLKTVLGIVRQEPAAGPLKEPPPYRFLKIAKPDQTRVFFFNKEMAQSLVRIEFGDGRFNETNSPVVELFNDYFGGGMAGIVFQELREARALAYSVGAVYSAGSRKGEENVMNGFIGCQADKTPEALDAFLELFEHLPSSQDRFADSRDSVLSRYRTGKLGFRDIAGAVRAWERLGVPVDPRRSRFEKIQHLQLEDMLRFDRQHLQNRPMLISVVGDERKVDLEKIRKAGPVTELKLADIFVN